MPTGNEDGCKGRAVGRAQLVIGEMERGLEGRGAKECAAEDGGALGDDDDCDAVLPEAAGKTAHALGGADDKSVAFRQPRVVVERLLCPRQVARRGAVADGKRIA